MKRWRGSDAYGLRKCSNIHALSTATDLSGRPRCGRQHGCSPRRGFCNAQCFWIKADSQLRSTADDDSPQQVRGCLLAAAMTAPAIRRLRPRYMADTERCAYGARMPAPCGIKVLYFAVVLWTSSRHWLYFWSSWEKNPQHSKRINETPQMRMKINKTVLTI
jgi:hypothetical protein